MNLFNTKDGYYLLTDADKETVKRAVRIVKNLRPDDYEYYHIEGVLNELGWSATIYNCDVVEEVEFL
jgi:hypothetical protein